MLKKFHWPSLYSRNPREKIFFSSKFFNQSDFEKKLNSILRFFSHWNREISEQWCWKNSIDLCWILQIRGKNFFFWNFFNQSEFEKKSNCIFRFFCHWNREMSEQWCWKNSTKLCCILQIREKNFFFLKFFQTIGIRVKITFNNSIFFSLESRDQWTVMLKKFHWPSLYSWNPREKIFFSENFSTNQNSRKNQIQLFDFFLIGIKRSVNSDAEKILLTFVVFSKSARKNFFFIKIFVPMRFREKIKYNYSIFLSL